MSKEKKSECCKIKTIHPDDVKRNKIQTLNNILCMMNDEVKIVKSINENSKEAFEKNSAKRQTLENILILANAFSTLNDGER